LNPIPDRAVRPILVPLSGLSHRRQLPFGLLQVWGKRQGCSLIGRRWTKHRYPMSQA